LFLDPLVGLQPDPRQVTPRQLIARELVVELYRLNP